MKLMDKFNLNLKTKGGSEFESGHISQKKSMDGPVPVWEIKNNFKCPVIGACLDAVEHKKVLKRAGFKTKNLKLHYLHQAIMMHLDDKNPISEKVDRYLAHKYRNELPELMSMKEDVFMKEWGRAIESGDVAARLYAAARRTDLSSLAVSELFGTVHMLSHANLETVVKARQGLDAQKQANIKIARLLKMEKRRARALAKDVSNQKAMVQKFRTRLCQQAEIFKKKADEFQEPLSRTTDIAGSVNRETEPKDIIKRLEAKNNFLEKKLQEMNERVARMKSKNADLRSSNWDLGQKMESMVFAMSGSKPCQNECNPDCPQFGQCPKRVLVVGGITKMKQFYKNAVHQAGGEFDYHDGYMNRKKPDLESRVRKSDLILCPVNVNSHNACLAVKKFCIKHKKPLKILASSSLSAISAALTDDCATIN